MKNAAGRFWFFLFVLIAKLVIVPFGLWELAQRVESDGWVRLDWAGKAFGWD